MYGSIYNHSNGTYEAFWDGDLINNSYQKFCKEGRIRRFEMKAMSVWDNSKAFVEILNGVIISAGHTNKDETDNFCVTDEDPKWDVVASVLFEFYQRRKDYGNDFYVIAGSLDKNTDEYKKLHESMEAFLQEENSSLEEMIKKNNAILEEI